jgi:hypothetical protein
MCVRLGARLHPRSKPNLGEQVFFAVVDVVVSRGHLNRVGTGEIKSINNVQIGDYVRSSKGGRVYRLGHCYNTTANSGFFQIDLPRNHAVTCNCSTKSDGRP